MCKVSVIMPLYNAEKYVYKAVNSILNQSFRDFELRIVDDCSVDNSSSIVSEFNDGRIKLLSN